MIYDYIIIGAGISGAAAAYELSGHGSVLLLEMESAPGYHSTGRSAALYTRNFGNEIASKICQASHDFLAHPPDSFTEAKILTPRGHLFVDVETDPDMGLEVAPNALIDAIKKARPESPIEEISIDEAMTLAPLLNREKIKSAAYEEGVYDIDVDALHQAYLFGFKKTGGVLQCDAKVDTITRQNEHWEITHKTGVEAGKIIINAAGAWADEIASVAGISKLGLIPKRRTAIIVDAPDGMNTTQMPAVDFVGTPAYMKPDAGRILASPGDQTPIEPQDAQPEEIDIATIAYYLEEFTQLKVNRIEHNWAGLRTYTSDGAPIVGFDKNNKDFFWLAGQGGYGIMMAPALGRAAASLIAKNELPHDFTSLGITQEMISPTRFELS